MTEPTPPNERWNQLALRGESIRNLFRDVIAHHAGKEPPRQTDNAAEVVQHLEPELRALMQEVADSLPASQRVTMHLSIEALGAAGVAIVVENVFRLESSETRNPETFKAVLAALETTVFPPMQFTGIVSIDRLELPLHVGESPRVPSAQELPLPFDHALNEVDLSKDW